MAIAAHDDEVGAGIGGVRQDRVGYVEIPTATIRRTLDLEAVPGEMVCDVTRLGIFVTLAGIAGDDHDLHPPLARARNGMASPDRTGGVAAAVPARRVRTYRA